jgi:hypothetical protein
MQKQHLTSKPTTSNAWLLHCAIALTRSALHTSACILLAMIIVPRCTNGTQKRDAKTAPIAKAAALTAVLALPAATGTPGPQNGGASTKAARGALSEC